MKNKFSISVLLTLIMISVWIGVSEATVSDIANSVVRLHIIANSDDQADQALKLKIRDRILKEVNTMPHSDKIDLSYMQNHKNEILAVCRDEIQKNGYDYDVQLEAGQFYFPTKSYQNVALPAGNYDAVKIVIGNGIGQNWWCVMYPPLCFTSESKGKLTDDELQKLKDSLGKDNFDLISGQDAHTVVLRPSFKIVEVWQTVKHKLVS